MRKISLTTSTLAKKSIAFAPELLTSPSEESVSLVLDPDFDATPSRRSDSLAEKMFHLVLPRRSRIKAAAYGSASAEFPEFSCLLKLRDWQCIVSGQKRKMVPY